MASIFDEITWLGFGQNGSPPGYSRLTRHAKITFQILPNAVGGKSLWDKLTILPKLGSLIRMVVMAYSRAEIVHTRGPSLPALIAIIYSFFSTKPFWHKYAGNWVEDDPPFSYWVQTFLLKRLRTHKVTVNGFWDSQQNASNILSFENPCFSVTELMQAHEKARNKNYQAPWVLAFIGRVESEKGIFVILKAVEKLVGRGCPISKLIIAGDGKDLRIAKDMSPSLLYPVEILGAVSRDVLNGIYEESHFLILPSRASEGFPKVIAEAACFGCVPIVSAVSAVSHYIKSNENGVVIEEVDEAVLAAEMEKLLNDVVEVRRLGTNALQLGSYFTYERYLDRVSREILNEF